MATGNRPPVNRRHDPLPESAPPETSSSNNKKWQQQESRLPEENFLWLFALPSVNYSGEFIGGFLMKIGDHII
jgi:hypothetical protein